MQDIARMHRNFYNLRNKLDQDNFILQHCRIAKCSRIRLKNASRGPKNLTAEYYVTIKNSHNQIRVCKSTFLNVLKVGKDRVTGILQRSYKDGGSTAKENRGGNHKIARYAEKRRRVEQFIESLEAAEPHYCRAKSSIRLYLPPELNIVKLWKMYQEQVQDMPQLKVKQSFFRDIFNKKYNVGFGSPLKDTCSRCFELTRKIETASTSQEKVTFMTQKGIHTLKAKAFYELLKVEPEHTISLSFDCQKNNPLPKLPDQAAYFSRQFNMYNFTVVIGTSKSALDNEHATVYHLGDDDVEVRDWKKEVNKTLKIPGSWHFKFNPSKRFMLHRGRQNVSVQGEEDYRSEIGQPKYVTKRGKKISEITPAILQRGNKVNPKKILDVANLLKKHFGEDWRTIDSLKYFKEIEEYNDNFVEHEDLQCVALEESENFI
ncbi:hypothetical protein SFRURICE_012618 [Spodoptera frugiperda]|nr:hypothetical protein SFRURICE_012618 [Spodoptera frugiperda]